jgi:predicted enzyme related to lactoylglutathione lyase
MRVRGYAAGNPCWAAVASAEPEATRAFYGGLFGWEHAGGKFVLDGRAVAGIRERGRGPAAWLISIATDDSAAVAEAVPRARGRVRVPPRPVGTEGTAAIWADPAGAVFGTWERDSFIGAQVSFEPGAICWYELAARDLPAVDEFYGEVFGWRVLEAESQPGEPYFEFHHFGDTVAGLMPVDHRFPSSDIPSHWTVCFMVDDCADACDLAAELGGTVARKPAHIASGWYARLADPQGAHFAIIELADELRMD